MNPMPAKFWKLVGWLGVSLVVIAIPYAMVDGVMGVFVLYAAMIVGGISGIGVKARATFGIAIILLSIVITSAITHYTATTGMRAPDFSLIKLALAVLALPMIVSVALLALGEIHRRMSAPRPG